MSPATNCPVDGFGSGPGGYTYADFGKIIGRPEVHADGEIWVQTLWEMRELLGSAVTESIVTRGMELSPPEPSFLDMRNAILQADQVVFAGAHANALWTLFAERGMGYYAAAVGRQRRRTPWRTSTRPRIARSTRAARSPAPSRTPCRARRCRACTSGSPVTCPDSAATSAT